MNVEGPLHQFCLTLKRRGPVGSINMYKPLMWGIGVLEQSSCLLIPLSVGVLDAFGPPSTAFMMSTLHQPTLPVSRRSHCWEVG